MESIATLTICGSSFLAGDKPFYMPSVRIKEMVIRAGAYDIYLCVSLHWSPAGDFLLHLVGGLPETVDVSKTK
jgi:hypothetical protein